jgi:hypothetical protein
MPKSSAIKLALAAVLFGWAAVALWQFLRNTAGVSEKAFFLDLSERKLFVAARGLVPPIRGLNDAAEDAVRAVVISTNATPDDRRTWTIAYLEKYTSELKQQMEQARSTGASPPMGRAAAQAHRLVKRPDDPGWVSVATPEGEAIVTQWAQPGPNGITPVVCTP